MQPGEVHLEETSLEQITGTSDFSESVVFGGTPVYEEDSGKLFGVVAIETDLESGLRKIMDGFIDQDQQVYVVNSNHRILLHLDHEGEFQSVTRGQGCDCLPLEVQQYLLDEQALDTYSDGESIVARKHRFNESANSDWICFVLVSE